MHLYPGIPKVRLRRSRGSNICPVSLRNPFIPTHLCRLPLISLAARLHRLSAGVCFCTAGALPGARRGDGSSRSGGLPCTERERALYLLKRVAEATVDESQSHMKPEVCCGLRSSMTAFPNENVGFGPDVRVILLLQFFKSPLLPSSAQVPKVLVLGCYKKTLCIQ